LFLGIERQRAERTLGPFTRRRGIDDFCLAGDREIVAGFPSVSLLARVPEAVAKALKGRAVLLVTTNPFYATHSGVRPGMTLAEARTQQPLHNPIASGGERWYVTLGSKAASLVAATRTDQVALLRSFGL
jgi:hypothetical protein